MLRDIDILRNYYVQNVSTCTHCGTTVKLRFCRQGNLNVMHSAIIMQFKPRRILSKTAPSQKSPAKRYWSECFVMIFNSREISNLDGDLYTGPMNISLFITTGSKDTGSQNFYNMLFKWDSLSGRIPESRIEVTLCPIQFLMHITVPPRRPSVLSFLYII